MTLNEVKTYIENRPFPLDIPSDTDLEKFMNFALLIIKVFYGVDFTDEETEDAIAVIGEQVAYLIENNPFEDIYKQYNYLKSFTIGNGAVKGEVFEKIIGLLGTFVKNLMAALGYELLQSSDGKAYYTYSIF